MTHKLVPVEGKRYERRDGTITPPLMGPKGARKQLPLLELTVPKEYSFLFDPETMYVYSDDPDDAEWAWRVYPLGDKQSDSDLMKEAMQN